MNDSYNYQNSMNSVSNYNQFMNTEAQETKEAQKQKKDQEETTAMGVIDPLAIPAISYTLENLSDGLLPSSVTETKNLVKSVGKSIFKDGDFKKAGEQLKQGIKKAFPKKPSTDNDTRMPTSVDEITDDDYYHFPVAQTSDPFTLNEDDFRPTIQSDNAEDPDRSPLQEPRTLSQEGSATAENVGRDVAENTGKEVVEETAEKTASKALIDGGFEEATEGGYNPINDVIGLAMGVGGLILGELGLNRQKQHPFNYTPLNPSTQFGV